MLGPKIKVRHKEYQLTLSTPRESDVAQIANLQREFKESIRYTVLEEITNHKEWLNARKKSTTSILWCILANNKAIGIADLHWINSSHSATTQTIIFDPKYQKKGIGTSVHLARLLYSVSHLNIHTLVSYVRSTNKASLLLLEKLGYIKNDGEIKTFFSNGEFVDTNVLTWLNPKKLKVLFSNKGAPKKYIENIKKAEQSIQIARKICKIYK